jgi:hypothetical protein
LDPRTLQVGGELARSIADFEQQSQMTLMHRFNKAADLLDQVLQVCSSSPQHPGTQRRTPCITRSWWFCTQPAIQWCKQCCG